MDRFAALDQTNTSHSSDYRGLRSRTTSQYRKWISETLHRPRHWSPSQFLIALSISITWILSPTPQITFYITMHSWNSSMLMSFTYSEQEDQKSRYFWNDPLLFWEQSTRPGLVIDVVNLRITWSYFYSIMPLKMCRLHSEMLSSFTGHKSTCFPARPPGGWTTNYFN